MNIFNLDKKEMKNELHKTLDKFSTDELWEVMIKCGLVIETNYLFLDVDGVLNNENHIVNVVHGGSVNSDIFKWNRITPFDPKCLYNLSLLKDKVDNLKIILSSTWRLSKDSIFEINHRLIEYGLIIDDITGRSEDGHRGKEIKEFLKDKENYNFVILDDDSFDIVDTFPDNFVLIDNKVGLTEENIKLAIEIFN